MPEQQREPAQRTTEPSPFGTEYDPGTLRLILWLAPVGFALAYVLAAIQGAQTWLSLLLGAILGLGTLAAAGLYRLRGSAGAKDVVWVRVLLAIVTALARR